jgi:LacI family transcriptional regulator
MESKVYTIKDIARMAGVSVTTVSRVLNRRPDVNPATRQLVEKVIESCHFVGNSNARGLKQISEVIGLVIRGRSNPFLSALAEAILDQASSLSDNFVTEYIDEQDDEFQTALRMTRQNRVKGLIFVGSLIDDRVHVLRHLDLPVVFTTVHAESAAMPRASSVAVDDRGMGRLIGEHLLSLGHRKIAVFGSNPVAGDSLAMRFQGFCDALADCGLSFDPGDYRECRFSFDAGYETARAYFADHPETTALFTMSDTVAVGAIRALRDLQKAVPRDVSVIGFDGIDIGRFTVPRLTTVEQPVNEIARESVNLLLDMMERGASPRHIQVKASFRSRESVAPPSLPEG